MLLLCEVLQIYELQLTLSTFIPSIKSQKMIFVTGGSGLVGSHLLYELCNADENVTALIRDKKSISNIEKTFSYYSNEAPKLIKKINWVTGDLNDYYSLLDMTKGAEKVFHTAAVVSYIPGDKIKIIKENTKMAQNIVNVCLINNVPLLCHFSSIAALGEGDHPITEKTSFEFSKNNSGYSVGKFNAELEVWRGVAEGLNAIVINPSVIIGPGDWNRSSPALFKTVAKGLKFYTEGTTGFVDVRDVVKTAILLVNKNKVNERFLLNGENKNYKWLFTTMARELKVKPPSIKVNPFLASIACGFELFKYRITRKEPLITKETARISQKKLTYSSEKIIEEIGIDFIRIEESIKHTAEKFRRFHES